MRIPKYIIPVLFTLLSVSAAQQNMLPVLPQPKEVEFSGESLKLDNISFEVENPGGKYVQIKTAAEELNSLLKKINGESESRNNVVKIIVGIPSENKTIKDLAKKYGLSVDKKLGPEAYKLLVTKKEIIVTANAQKGVFYGLQSLIQMMRAAGKHGEMYCVKITDWPSLEMRAVMDDISRGPLPTMDFMKYQIRRFAEMKVNTFFHYVEHVVKTKSHPEFAPADGSFTIEQWKEIADYALNYNITVIGGFQSFGHFNNILQTPEYAHLGESGTLISPVNPEGYKFLEDIFAEMIPVFHSEYFNINCDETFDLGKDASKKLVDSLGYAEVYFRHIMKLHDIVKKLGKKTIMWGDILLQYPDLLKRLPKDILIGTWTYDPLESYADFILPIREAGFKFIVVPGVLNSSKIFPNYSQSFANIKNFAGDAEKLGAYGLMNTVWDDGGNAFFSNDWYGVAYGADKSWNPGSSDSAAYQTRFNKALYAARDNSYTEAIEKLNQLAGLEATDAMTDKILFAKLLPEPGKSTRISVNGWDDVLKIAGEANEILKNCDVKTNKNDIEYLRFVIKIYETLARERFALLDAAENYIKAGTVYKESPFAARDLVVHSLAKINGIILDEEKLKAEFEKFWLGENHTYAMNWITEKYEDKIASFADVKNRILSSLKSIDSGGNILPADSVGLAISKLPGKYFREWMMIEPLPNDDGSKLSRIDYLADMGGEISAAPKVTQEFYYGQVKYRWRRVVSEQPDIVDLSAMFPDNSGEGVMYAAAFIDAENDATVEASAGCREGIEVFINGKSVFEKISSELTSDEFDFSIPLHKGRNNLLIKISKTGGGWGFTFRLPNSEVRNSKNRYRVVTE